VRVGTGDPTTTQIMYPPSAMVNNLAGRLAGIRLRRPAPRWSYARCP
jgi:hypothetical protein